jgi:hypothetical protein
MKGEWTHVYEGHNTRGKTYIQLAVTMCWWSRNSVVNMNTSRWCRSHMVLQKHPHTTPHNFQGIFFTSREDPFILSGIGRCRHCGAYKRTAYCVPSREHKAISRTAPLLRAAKLAEQPPETKRSDSQALLMPCSVSVEASPFIGCAAIRCTRATHTDWSRAVKCGTRRGAERWTIAFPLLKNR